MDRQAPKLIRKIKDRYGLTQVELARLLGVSQPAVSEYERGLVAKERYDVISRLQDILEGNVVIPAENDFQKIAREITDAAIRKKTGGPENKDKP